jgi:hypothetical protein
MKQLEISVEIEGYAKDSYSLVACHTKHAPSSLLVREMKSLVSNFQVFSIQFVKRETNKVARACARAALSIDKCL